mgnify:CR=1 FL=1
MVREEGPCVAALYKLVCVARTPGVEREVADCAQRSKAAVAAMLLTVIPMAYLRQAPQRHRHSIAQHAGTQNSVRMDERAC